MKTKSKPSAEKKPKMISFCGKSNMGRVRKNNEDAFVVQYIWDDHTVLAVAIDGVGGYEGGEIAADIARRTIPEYLSASPNGERVELLKQAVTAANNAIFEAREADPEHSQMSCVLTAAIIDVAQRTVSMAHVGDSRLYSFHQGTLKKLSHDHSLVGYREEIGDLTEEEAMHHPQRNVIGRDVGSQKHKANDEEFIEAQVIPLQPNTILLFCSDGLTDMITSSTITGILAGKNKLEGKADALIEAALDAGGKDNVTVVLVEFQSNEPQAAPAKEKLGKVQPQKPATKLVQPEPAVKQPSRKNRLGAIVCLIIGLILGGAAAYAYLNNKAKSMGEEKEKQQKALNDSITTLRDSIMRLNLQLQELQQDTIAMDTVSTDNPDL